MKRRFTAAISLANPRFSFAYACEVSAWHKVPQWLIIWLADTKAVFLVIQQTALLNVSQLKASSREGSLNLTHQKHCE